MWSSAVGYYTLLAAEGQGRKKGLFPKVRNRPEDNKKKGITTAEQRL